MTPGNLLATAIVCALAATGCAAPHVLNAPLPAAALLGTDGTAHDLPADKGAHFTVLVFFAANCPCQAVHDARLVDLARAYRERGVDFYVVDPEASASPERDGAEASRRGYPFPILIDKNATLARRLGAEYATESFIVDRQGVVRYHGGIDSDKTTLHDGAQPFLKDALEDLVSGRPPRLADAKTLGCALQIW
jgi:peroxiredoxin